MPELSPDIIAVLQESIRGPLVALFVLAVIFKAIFPDLQSAVHDARMPLPAIVQWVYWVFVVGTVCAMLLLCGLILYRLFA